LSSPLLSSLSDSAIVNGVYWSEALNKVFVDNFERDPSLIWQYFGSAKGFFRQYPAWPELSPSGRVRDKQGTFSQTK
uniref:VWA N-terminal domain-containing protein n=1 Tax=Hucho hucho TaxID=62062 RepID=A0A4W5P2E4_9TELE